MPQQRSQNFAEVSWECPMTHTTESLARELNVSERQVLNYKKTVEAHLGFAITYRQGRNHFYIEKYVPLLRRVQIGQPLLEAPIEVLAPEPPIVKGGRALLQEVTEAYRDVAAG
jgi:hypothetical protein